MCCLKIHFLKKYLAESEFIFQEPVTISQISFDKKKQVENHVLMLGDAAGNDNASLWQRHEHGFSFSKACF